MKFSIHLSIAFVLIYSVALAQNSFNRINCGGNITLNIKQSDSCSYAAGGDSNSASANKLNFAVQGKTLYITSGASNNAIANVAIKDLKDLNISGTAKVNCLETLLCDELSAEFSGAANAHLKIKANTLLLEAKGAAIVHIEGISNHGSLSTGGASKVNAKKCVFNTCEVIANGASTCSLDSVSSDLKVNAKGASKIYLSKIPEVYVSSRNGAGEVIEGNASRDSSLSIETKIVITDEETDSENGKHKHPRKPIKNAGFNWAGLDLGLNGMLNTSGNLKAPAGYDYLEMNNASSMQVNLNLFEKTLKIHKRYVLGLVGAGFSWNHYKFVTPEVLQPYKPTLTAASDSGVVLNVNKLRVSYFNVPLMIGFNTHENEKKAFHVAFGVVTGIRMGAMVKTTTDSKEGKNKDKTFALYNTDQIKYDFMIRMKYKWANIWASYSLNGLFKKNQGPVVHPVAVGVNVLEF